MGSAQSEEAYFSLHILQFMIPSEFVIYPSFSLDIAVYSKKCDFLQESAGILAILRKSNSLQGRVHSPISWMASPSFLRQYMLEGPAGNYYANQVTLHEKCHVTFNCEVPGPFTMGQDII